MSCAITPEEFFIKPKESKFPIDAINCAFARADAILTMLIVTLSDQENQQFHPHTIGDALWQVQANMEQIKCMTDHSYQAMHKHIYASGREHRLRAERG